MNNIISKTKNKIFFVSPEKIKYCIIPSKYCDFTQFKLTKLHPHAGVNRGFFKENLSGNIKINSSQWDHKPGPLFIKLLEFEALQNHYTGKESWKKSKFAERSFEYLKKNNQLNNPRTLKKDFKNYSEFLLKREQQIDELFNSILKKGIYPMDLSLASNKYKKLASKTINKKKNKSFYIDNISVALTKDKKLFFNNRGHHRLSIAKILKLKSVPVTIVLAKSKSILEKFVLSQQ